MSELPAHDPDFGHAPSCDAIETIIIPRAHDLGGFQVRRALPAAKRQMIGPFIFFDQMGPSQFVVGEGIDVRPHPHIGLSTLTYLFDGEIVHRDSLGTELAIRPGAVNWMTAGRGITHSERSGAEFRAKGSLLSGLQTWVALPASHEEIDPGFTHLSMEQLPRLNAEGKDVRLVAGSLLGAASPLNTFSDTLFADVQMQAGTRMPFDAQHEERGLYIFSGQIAIAGDVFEAGRLLVFRAGDAITIEARSACRIVLIGGAAMDGPRHIWWNFVSSRKDRIDMAKADWKAGRFDTVPGEHEFIPLPE